MPILSIIALPEELLINKHYLSAHLLQLDPSKGRMEEMQPLVVNVVENRIFRSLKWGFSTTDNQRLQSPQLPTARRHN